MCYWREKPQNSCKKNLSTAFQTGNDPLLNKLDYKNTKRPSNPKLSNVLEPSNFQLPTSNYRETSQSLVFTNFLDPATLLGCTTTPFRLYVVKLQYFPMNQDTLNRQFVCKLCLDKSSPKVYKFGEGREETFKEFSVKEG